MKKGMLIVLEGMDFSGKTTLVSCLKKQLTQNFPDREIVLTRQPNNPKIRQLLLQSFEKHYKIETELFYFLIDRQINFKKVVLPALNSGKIVICDRFFYSTFVYQSDMVKKDFLKTEQIHKLLDLFIIPDLVVFLNPDVKNLLLRKYKDKLDKRDHFAFANLNAIKLSYEKIFAYYKSQKHPIIEINNTDLTKACESVYNIILKNPKF